MNRHKRTHLEQRVVRPSRQANSASRRFRIGSVASQRVRGHKNEKHPYSPPEDWYDPEYEQEQVLVRDTKRKTKRTDYRIVVQPPGKGYRHVVTPQEIRSRLAELPAAMLAPLEVIQLSRMTRKKESFPCYGMQWGATLYLYPMEEELIEYYGTPPKPAQLNEAKMFGGRWFHSRCDDWQLIWTPKAIRDFYLNNILIHELGHLLDNRNQSYLDRERYAEWFAIEHGYRRTKRRDKRARQQKKPKHVVRRHHSC